MHTNDGCFVTLMYFEFGFVQFVSEYFLNMKYETLEPHHNDKPPKYEKTKTVFIVNYVPITNNKVHKTNVL